MHTAGKEREKLPVGLVELAKCCARKKVKRDTSQFQQNEKKNALVDPKNNRMEKNEMGMGKYSLRYHAYKISREISAQKNYKRDTVQL